MNILHVISTLDPAAGGPPRVVAELASQQSSRGLSVTVCTTDAAIDRRANRGAAVAASMGTSGVEVVQCRVLFAPFLVSREMNRWIREQVGRFDVVHIHGIYRYHAACAANHARAREVPYVVSPHGALDPYVRRRSHHALFLKRYYERWVELPNLNRADVIHFSSPMECERAADLSLRPPSVVIPNAVGEAAFQPVKRCDEFRADHDIPLGVPLILFVGRLNFVKGLDLLLAAFCDIKREVPDAMLALVGPDGKGYERHLMGLATSLGVAQSVRFGGLLDPERVRAAYGTANLFVLPSRSESFGMSLLEAMAAGCPVIVSNEVGLSTEVKASRAGWVVGLDRNQIKSAIVRLLKDPTAARSVGRSGADLVRRAYTWEVVEPQFRKLYQRVARGGKGA